MLIEIEISKTEQENGSEKQSQNNQGENKAGEDAHPFVVAAKKITAENGNRIKNRPQSRKNEQTSKKTVLN